MLPCLAVYACISFYNDLYRYFNAYSSPLSMHPPHSIMMIMIPMMIIPMMVSTPVRMDSDPSTTHHSSQDTTIAVPVDPTPTSPDPSLPSECLHFADQLNIACLTKLIQDTCTSHHITPYAPSVGFRTEHPPFFNTFIYKLNMARYDPITRMTFLYHVKHDSLLPIFYDASYSDQDRYFEIKCRKAVPESKHFDAWYKGATLVRLLFYV